MSEAEREKEVDANGKPKRDNIFKELLRSNKLAQRGLDLDYAAGEAFVIFTGGVEVRTISHRSFCCFQN